jgi:hypothetical protein
MSYLAKNEPLVKVWVKVWFKEYGTEKVKDLQDIGRSFIFKKPALKIQKDILGANIFIDFVCMSNCNPSTSNSSLQ